MEYLSMLKDLLSLKCYKKITDKNWRLFYFASSLFIFPGWHTGHEGVVHASLISDRIHRSTAFTVFPVAINTNVGMCYRCSIVQWQDIGGYNLLLETAAPHQPEILEIWSHLLQKCTVLEIS